MTSKSMRKMIEPHKYKSLSYKELQQIYKNNQYDDDYEYVILIIMYDKLKKLIRITNSKVKTYNDKKLLKLPRKEKSKQKQRRDQRKALLKRLNKDKEKIFIILTQKNIFTNIRETKEYKEAVKEYKKNHNICEITGKHSKLVLHHKASVDSNPELACDKSNFVVVTDEIHKAFHKQYGYGNNTPEQWDEFVYVNFT